MIDLDAKRFEEARGRLREAIEWQRKALASNPANRTYRQFLANQLTNLIKAAQGLGDSKAVSEAERELAELHDSDPAMMALDTRLSAIIQDNQQPKDNPEQLQLAQRAYDKALHATAAKLWGDALDADPKLAEDRQAQHRYNAACAAALAGCGQGKDEKPLDDASKAKLREQARGWLQAELDAWTKLLESGPAAARPFVAQTLKHWQEDSDLAGVREAKALKTLPGAEREASAQPVGRGRRAIGQGTKAAGAHWKQMTLRYRPFPFNLSESRVGIRRGQDQDTADLLAKVRSEMLSIAGQKVGCSPVDRRKKDRQVLFWKPDLPRQGEMLRARPDGPDAPDG